MKSKTIWIIVGIVILLAVLYWGSQTNWWGLKKSTTMPTATSTTAITAARMASSMPQGSRLIFVSNGSLDSCPRGNFVLGPKPDGTYDCYKQAPPTA